MSLSNCEKCKYYCPSSSGTRCAVNPKYYNTVWKKFKDLDSMSEQFVTIVECNEFKLRQGDRVIKTKEEKFPLQFDLFLVFYFCLSAIIANYDATRAPIYKHSGFPPVLSESARAKAPECVAIFNDLKVEAEYQKRSRSLKTLGSCLKDTSLSSYSGRLMELSNYYKSTELVQKIDTNTLNVQYEELIEELDRVTGVYGLIDYEFKFFLQGFLRVMIYSFAFAVGLISIGRIYFIFHDFKR